MKEPEICQKALEELLMSKREFVLTKEEDVKTVHVFKNSEGDLDSCYIKGDRIIWRVEKADFLKGFVGRWRDHKLDDIIRFKTNPLKIKINRP